MGKSSNPKSQYVDISFGWQDRGDAARLQSRRRRRLWLCIVAAIVLAAVIFLLRWLN